MRMRSVVPVEAIERKILLIRGRKVMLDSDLAKLYGVPTFRFNEQVRRNLKRFPEDFMFQLTKDEHRSLISQFAISKIGRGGRRFLPYVFTEHGALMAANVLKSEKAIEASIYVVRAFAKLREMIASHKDLARRLAELEKKYDSQFKVVFDAIRQLMEPAESKPRRIGFHAKV
jgi:hypothetical protein